MLLLVGDIISVSHGNPLPDPGVAADLIPDLIPSIPPCHTEISRHWIQLVILLNLRLGQKRKGHLHRYPFPTMYLFYVTI